MVKLEISGELQNLKPPISGFEERVEPPPPLSRIIEKQPNSGHRERLRERFRQFGSEQLADYELLELLLFRTIPRTDTKPLAKALINRFGSLGEVFGAPERLLTEVQNSGDAVALDLKIIEAVSKRIARNNVMGREVLGAWSQVIAYCMTAMAHEPREQFRILFLDKKNRLIADEVQQQGTVDHTPVYPREVVRRALELSATALIVVHNYPARYPTGIVNHA